MKTNQFLLLLLSAAALCAAGCSKKNTQGRAPYVVNDPSHYDRKKVGAAEPQARLAEDFKAINPKTDAEVVIGEYDIYKSLPHPDYVGDDDELLQWISTAASTARGNLLLKTHPELGPTVRDKTTGGLNRVVDNMQAHGLGAMIPEPGESAAAFNVRVEKFSGTNHGNGSHPRQTSVMPQFGSTAEMWCAESDFDSLRRGSLGTLPATSVDDGVDSLNDTQSQEAAKMRNLFGLLDVWSACNTQTDYDLAVRAAFEAQTTDGGRRLIANANAVAPVLLKEMGKNIVSYRMTGPSVAVGQGGFAWARMPDETTLRAGFMAGANTPLKFDGKDGASGVEAGERVRVAHGVYPDGSERTIRMFFWQGAVDRVECSVVLPPSAQAQFAEQFASTAKSMAAKFGDQRESGYLDELQNHELFREVVTGPDDKVGIIGRAMPYYIWTIGQEQDRVMLTLRAQPLSQRVFARYQIGIFGAENAKIAARNQAQAPLLRPEIVMIYSHGAVETQLDAALAAIAKTMPKAGPVGTANGRPMGLLEALLGTGLGIFLAVLPFIAIPVLWYGYRRRRAAGGSSSSRSSPGADKTGATTAKPASPRSVAADATFSRPAGSRSMGARGSQTAGEGVAHKPAAIATATSRPLPKGKPYSREQMADEEADAATSSTPPGGN